MNERPIHNSSRCGDAPTGGECAAPLFHLERSSPFSKPHQLTAPAGCRDPSSCATASSDYWTSTGWRNLPQEMQVPSLPSASIVPARQLPAMTQVRCKNPFGAGNFLELIVLSLLFATCFLPVVSCIREHIVKGEGELGAAMNADLVSPHHTADIEEKLSALLESQLSQVENQQRLEALATPFAVGKNAAEVPNGGHLTELSMVDLGSPLSAGEAGGSTATSVDSLQLTQVNGITNTDAGRPFSFLNWGQVGGLMQSPALAHTGMGVQMPRQVVGTTVGLDFDSPATFHGPLLVALMVCILIFFVVLMLCCWMVKSKRKHDKFMAEKLPR